MSTDGAQARPCEWEAIVAMLIARVRRSQFAAEIRIYAEHFRSQGYAPDVALKIAADYWLG